MAGPVDRSLHQQDTQTSSITVRCPCRTSIFGPSPLPSRSAAASTAACSEGGDIINAIAASSAACREDQCHNAEMCRPTVMSICSHAETELAYRCASSTNRRVCGWRLEKWRGRGGLQVPRGLRAACRIPHMIRRSHSGTGYSNFEMMAAIEFVAYAYTHTVCSYDMHGQQTASDEC